MAPLVRDATQRWGLASALPTGFVLEVTSPTYHPVKPHYDASKNDNETPQRAEEM